MKVKDPVSKMVKQKYGRKQGAIPLHPKVCSILVPYNDK